MASSTMQRLMASINGGGAFSGVAHTNKFQVLINTPFGSSSQETEGITLRCDAVTMPGRTMNTTPVNERYGPATQMVDGWTFEDVTCSFLADTSFKVRDFFSTWHYNMYDAQEPFLRGGRAPKFNMRFYDDYVSDVEIYLLDNNGKATYGVKLVEAFPKTIGANEFNMATTNELQKISVTFAYRYWIEKINNDVGDDVDEPGDTVPPGTVTVGSETRPAD